MSIEVYCGIMSAEQPVFDVERMREGRLLMQLAILDAMLEERVGILPEWSVGSDKHSVNVDVLEGAYEGALTMMQLRAEFVPSLTPADEGFKIVIADEVEEGIWVDLRRLEILGVKDLARVALALSYVNAHFELSRQVGQGELTSKGLRIEGLGEYPRIDKMLLEGFDGIALYLALFLERLQQLPPEKRKVKAEWPALSDWYLFSDGVSRDKLDYRGSLRGTEDETRPASVSEMFEQFYADDRRLGLAEELKSHLELAGLSALEEPDEGRIRVCLGNVADGRVVLEGRLNEQGDESRGVVISENFCGKLLDREQQAHAFAYIHAMFEMLHGAGWAWTKDEFIGMLTKFGLEWDYVGDCVS